MNILVNLFEVMLLVRLSGSIHQYLQIAEYDGHGGFIRDYELPWYEDWKFTSIYPPQCTLGRAINSNFPQYMYHSCTWIENSADMSTATRNIFRIMNSSNDGMNYYKC